MHRRDEKVVVARSQRKKPTELSVSFVWFNYDKDKHRYAQVRTGGSKRCKVFTSRIWKMQQQSWFFPHGCSTKGRLKKLYKHFCWCR